MRRFLAVVCLCLAPLAAGAEPISVPAGQVHGECKRLTKQITRYKGVAQMAHERGDELWEASMKQHVKRLSDRRARRCPELLAKEREEQEARARKVARLIKNAAKAAATYFGQ